MSEHPPAEGARVQSAPSREELARAEARIRDLEAALELSQRKLANLEDGKAAEAALARSERRFATVIDQLHVGVIVQGPRSEILLHNARALELLGLTADEISGRSSFDASWQVIREDGTPYLPEQRPVAVALTTRAPVRGVLMGIARPRTSDLVWLLVNALPELDANGEVVQVVATMDDITERKQLEESLRQAQKLDSLGLLAGGIAHDFNNLLTVISNCTELAQMLLPPDSEAGRELDEVLAAAERATALTRQLLSFGGRQVTAPRRLDASAATQALHKLLGRLLGERHQLRIEPADDPAIVRVDQGQLEQVLVNLVVNARDAMPDGGPITIRVRRVEPGLAPGELGDRSAVEISVRDQGCGMSPETVERIFEPFFTTKPVGRGTGLGLATVHGIIRQAGGQIRVRSRLGEGSEFRVYLPEDAAEADVAAPPARLGGRGQGQTVLVVDDEPVLRSVVARMLGELGYRTLEAGDGFEALDLFEQRGEQIDLLLSDVVMPQMGGVELSHRVRQRWPLVQVVLMSGHAQLDDHDEFPIVADALLTKPFNRTALAQLVRKVLASHEPARITDS